MELRQYWQIIWRRWWLVAIVVGLVLVLSLATARPPAPAYVATMRFAIGIEGDEPVSTASGEGRSDAWLASEYLADDLGEVIMGGSFAAQLKGLVGFDVPAGVISASRTHRVMTVTITWSDPSQVQKIAEAVGAAIQDGGATYFPQLKGVSAQAKLIDGPAIAQAGRSLAEKLNLPIRLVVGLVAGVALAFVWEAFDTTVRDRGEVESLGAAVVGEIPRQRRWWRKR